MALDPLALARLLRAQDGVVSRRQVLGVGGTAADIRRLRRRREWVTVHDGVYVDHTGQLTRRQRLWAVVLLLEPAALHRGSALEVHGFQRDGPARPHDAPVHVMVDATRDVTDRPGVRIERIVGAHRWIQTGPKPPRTTVEFALLKEASARAPDGAIALLADGCRQGLTTAQRLLGTLEQLPKLPRRGLLAPVLSDVASGAHSLLEHRYLTQVERAHGLPTGDRQLRVAGPDRVVYRDVRYREHAALVELDGRFGHANAEDRWDDLDRDVAAAVGGELTVRLGWRQVLRPCRVADAIAAILRARGWSGPPLSCGSDCEITVREGSGPHADPDPSRVAREV